MADDKVFLDEQGLTKYDTLIKEYVNNRIEDSLDNVNKRLGKIVYGEEHPPED